MKKIFFVCLISLIIFWPSLFMFFTNDDFFFLKISKNPLQWFNNSFIMFRPLTTQVFYFFGGRNPLAMHIVSFLFFFGIIYLVYKLASEIFKNEKVALISAFLYTVSASHFGQLYYLAAFQELGMTFFVLLSCLAFLKDKKLLSFIAFILALLSKETAVVTPLLLGLIYLYQRKYNFKKFLVFISPFVICLFIYLFIRFKFYGFSGGNGYVWDFTPKKLINTLFWYLLWALNIPESLIDFIGPGLKINPNLFLYWGEQVMPILISFIFECLLLVAVYIKVLLEKVKKQIQERDLISVFCIAWFLIGILPVAFLPDHKFSFYLTLPLIGLVFRISYLLVSSKLNKYLIWLFLGVWTLTSILTLKFAYQTNWIKSK